MRFLIRQGPAAFVIGKYILTVLGIPFLLVFRRRTIFLPSSASAISSPRSSATYIILVAYQIGLLGQI